MSRKLTGVRGIVKGERYEINYRIIGKRYQYRINAASRRKAYNKKLEDMVEKRKNASLPLGGEERFNADFSSTWEKLHADLVADSLPKKTIYHYARTYKRLFNDFRVLKFPQIKSFKQLTLPYLRSE